MIFRDIGLDEWSKQHRIQPILHTCECGLESKTVVPVETSKSYGLVTEKCVCGTDKTGYTFVPKKQFKALVDNVINKFDK